MKAVAYNIKEYEKESLAVANGKAHDLTLISNPLNRNTIHYAYGKEVVVVSEDDLIDGELLGELRRIGIRKIVTRSITTDHIDLCRAYDLGIQIANTPFEDHTPKGIAEQTIRNLNLWGDGKCVGGACCCAKECKLVDDQLGYDGTK
ncbi:Rossmann-fold NAD(P)-binding domain-containing protein [Sphingobacterium haloxyli]|uniref:Lactate dehydrogenase n=1 Tax=Sphingobacterium haloxyli TaxID=2100533 RepID=A0A2S9IYI4_9SPHI|nr:lactate dehydrogenase [Sphingobacterium haloxyli]PRD45591.1 lactate dehydrogenase [Sphingobacterium haloxyli]